VSFRRYPKYNASGVEWLGTVPKEWEVRRLKFLCDIQTGGKDTEEAVQDGIYPFFVRSQKVERINSCTFDCEAVLTAGDGVGVGRVFHYHQGPFDFHQRVYMMNNFRGVSGRFLFHFLRENFYKVALEGGAKSTVDSLRRPLFANFPVALPSPDEQQSIVSFVDAESAKIDGLVAEQERLIELLKEKRQAIISHAVTRGLNPDAPMKPSGVGWLGDVPAHWEVEPLKYSISKIEQGWSPQCESGAAGEDEWGVLKVGCGNGDRFDPTEQKALPANIAPPLHLEIRAGDILMSRGNTLELVGMATFVGQVRPRLLLSDLLYRFRAKPARAEGPFLVSLLRSPTLRFQIEREATGTSASMKKIGQGTIRELIIALPSVEEQRAIISYIATETATLDRLTDEAQRAIDLLHERRSALISAAVTGQIDVRGLVQAEVA
jgi:type I restriction enzyme, S subunit